MIQTIYKEISLSISNDIPEYPKTCPLCGVGIGKDNRDHFQGPVYKCGGQYSLKPQIQNHTDKWWGSCPEREIKELWLTSLLEADVVVWVVHEDGTRFHVASFSFSNLAQKFARELSKDFPRFWDNGSKVSYIEIFGHISFSDGERYSKGKIIARKACPSHLKINELDRVWFSIKESDDCCSQISGELI